MKTRADSLRPGDRSGRLTVIDYSHSIKRKDGRSGERVMLCSCECGGEVKCRTSNFKSGNTKSCGCLHSESTSKSNVRRGEEK